MNEMIMLQDIVQILKSDHAKLLKDYHIAKNLQKWLLAQNVQPYSVFSRTLFNESQSSEYQFLLGFLYQWGIGTRVDFKNSFKWYTHAAESGDFLAHNNIGIFYENGLGVKINVDKAFLHYKISANGGNTYGKANLALSFIEGLGTKVDIQKGLLYLQEAAKAGHPSSQVRMGQRLLTDVHSKNLKQAFYWFSQAASHAKWCDHDLGDPEYLTYLGVCYQIGIGTSKDLHQGLRLYKMAFERGDKNAHWYLGRNVFREY
ncbi:hypothetical protein G9A89_019054 [Geosiphon pyriformis]|nr:hypothetical protein G9A89_019054 [Geosiphon pyriformis]